MADETDIYNSSDPGGGGGGGNNFFHVNYSIRNNTLIDYDDNKIKTAFPNLGYGGFFVGEEINLNGKSKIDFQIRYYTNDSTTPGRNKPIISYKGRNSNFEYGKLFTIFHDVTSGVIDIETSGTQTGFFTAHSINNKPANNSYKIKVNVDLNTRAISAYVDDVFAFTDFLGSVPEYWQPGFFLTRYYDGSYPAYSYIHQDEYIDMENTYLKIDDVLYLGL